jgi:hypothetical protein
VFESIDEYLKALKEAMQGSDPALVQDALEDAREHLSTALAGARETNPGTSEAELLQPIVEEYGTPEETAAAYVEIERRTSPGLARQGGKQRSFLARFFGVYADPRAWGALLYMFIAFVTGIIYFTWVVTGVSLSLAFSILIFGLLFALLFLLSARGLALIEGRIVEALLGVRMPRRPLFGAQGMKWFERLKVLLTDRRTWLSLVYLVLQLPLGILYFSLTVTLLSFSIGLVIAPIVTWILGLPTYQINDVYYYWPVWKLLLLQVTGIVLATLTMFMVRGLGSLHARYAKWMLVAE